MSTWATRTCAAKVSPAGYARLLACAAALALVLAGPAHALTAQDINAATFTPPPPPPPPGAKPAKDAKAKDKPAKAKTAENKKKDAGKPDALTAKVQVLLARRSISPGEIDGMDGENYRKALAQFRRQNNLGDGDQLDEPTWTALGGPDATPVVSEYELTKKDASEKFPKRIPRDYAKQAKMKKLDYTGEREMLAERFHMSPGLLAALNPKLSKAKAGDKLFVVSVERKKPEMPVERIEAVKATGMVVVYGANDAILASYPATIGSSETASPQGEHTVKRVVKNPPYHYDPEKNFQQGKNKKRLVLPAGPNNPVGTVWIGLSMPTFGIHGTPEPSQVSKTSSHGCVRLTNWDAEELASMVKPGVKMRFVEPSGT